MCKGNFFHKDTPVYRIEDMFFYKNELGKTVFGVF